MSESAPMNELVPASVRNMLDDGHRKSNQELIIDYLVSEPGTVQLSDKQLQILQRWEFADDLLRAGRYSSKEVARMLVKKFGYAMSSAWRDIDDARYVYGSCRRSSKPYILAAHIDRIEETIILAQKQGQMNILPKLFDSLTYALKELKEQQREVPAPTAIIFNISQQNTHLLPDTFSISDARDVARERLADKGMTIDFENDPS